MRIPPGLREFLQIRALPAVTRTISPASDRAANALARTFYSPDRRTNDYVEKILNYDRDLRIHVSTRSFIEWSVLMFGYYEPHIVRLIKRIVGEGDIAIDVGANVGCHTLLMSKLAGSGGRVIAYEPNPESAARLLANVSLNSIHNVDIRVSAASDSSDGGTLYVPPIGDALQGTASLNGSMFNAPVREFCVSMERIDALLARYDATKISFVKIDTEGHEVRVLNGAKELIYAASPVVLFEYDHDSWRSAGSRFEDVGDVLSSRVYQLYIVQKNGLTMVNESPLDYCNICAVPRSFSGRSLNT